MDVYTRLQQVASTQLNRLYALVTDAGTAGTATTCQSMGVGASSDSDVRDDHAAASRVHQLLSDAEYFQQAFAEVWHHCGGSNKASKGEFMQVMLQFMDVESVQGYGPAVDEMQRRTLRQLGAAADLLPSQLSRPEALNLFRTVLLAVQSLLIMQYGPASAQADSPRSPPSTGRRGQRPEEAESAGIPVSGSPTPTMMASSRAEDISEPGLALFGPVHPVLAALTPAVQDRLFACSSGLARKHLEAQTEQLRGLCAQLAASTREEQFVVQELENEAGTRAAAYGAHGAHSQSLNADQALQNLCLKLQAQQHDLRCHEEIKDEQHREIEALVSRRDLEEAEADEACRQATDLNVDIRSCRRTCGSLESEIESEEARAAALREAFEGRRSRFATAEAAARNAEISTMRATRRRIAAEVAARREAEAVVEAEHLREEQLAKTALHCEAISSEIAEARAYAVLQGVSEGPSRRIVDPATLKAELGTSLRREIDEAERANRAEVAEVEQFHREASELEAKLDSLNQHVATRESELHAMQRRLLRERSVDARTPTRGEVVTPSEDQKSASAAVLEAMERRVAEGRQREQALRDELGQVLACRSLSSARAANEYKGNETYIGIPPERYLERRLPDLRDRDLATRPRVRTMTTPMEAEQPGGTKKRGAPDAGEGLSLDAIREVIKGELSLNNVALKQEISQSVNKRMDSVEEKVGKQLERTLEKLAAMTDVQNDQGRTLATVQAEQKETGGRLTQLEQKVHQLQLHGGSSTADTEGGVKQPALILGGWEDDSPAAETLEKAKDMTHKLRVDIDMDSAFCPGVRRGYVIVPYKPRPNENGEQLRERLQQALRRIRTANIAMGKKDNGQTRFLWMQMSQSPERRRRAQLAGKVKRLILSINGGAAHGLEVANGDSVAERSPSVPGGEEPTGSTDESHREEANSQPPPHTFRPLKGVNCFHTATWNVGGLTADGTLDLLCTFGGAKHLCMLHAVMLQEVITAAGKFFKEKKGWKLVYGKREGEFRGEPIAFRTAVTTHSQTTVTNHAVTTVLRMHTGERWGMLSGHMPHHATIPEVDDILCRWGDQPALRTPKLVMGIDANEQFTEAATCPTAAHANTGRGEVILNWGVQQGLRLPPEHMADPSYYPYNQQHEPSRLDYVLLRKGHCLEAGPIAARDMASSDHEPVLAQIRAKVHKLAKQDRPGGVRHLRPPAGSNIPDHLQQAAEQPPGARRDQIAKLCREITKPGRVREHDQRDGTDVVDHLSFRPRSALLSVVGLCSQGVLELQEPMPEGVTEETRQLAQEAARKAQKVAAVLPASRGDRQWNTLRWWSDLQSTLLPAVALAEQRRHAYMDQEQTGGNAPQQAHPADVLALATQGTKEWTARTSQVHSTAHRLMKAAQGLREKVPFMGGEAIGPAVQTLVALEAWQQAYFGGTHAIHEGTQTDEDEGDANHADLRSPSLGERGSKRKADEPPRPSRWIGLHGITEQEAQELETDSFLADLGEVAEMATLPLPTIPAQRKPPQCCGRQQRWGNTAN
eukprot:s3659_g3.t1